MGCRNAIKAIIKQHGTIEGRGMLFSKLPSDKLLSYVKPRTEENRFGGKSVTYEGVESTKKWERIESYDPKFVENIVQAFSRNLLYYAMRNHSYQQIGEPIIECSNDIEHKIIR